MTQDLWRCWESGLKPISLRGILLAKLRITTKTSSVYRKGPFMGWKGYV